MTQIPLLYGPRQQATGRRGTHALALWRARDGILTPATENTQISVYSPLSGTRAPMLKDANGNHVTASPASGPVVGYWDLDGDGVCETPTMRTTSIEFNYCGFSDDIAGGWTAADATILSPQLSLGDISLKLLSDTNAGSAGSYSRTLITGAPAIAVLSFFVAEGNIAAASGSRCIVRDNSAGVNRVAVSWTWSTDAGGRRNPNLTVTTGRLLSKEFIGRRTYRHQTTGLLQTADIWRISVRTDGTYVSGNTNVVQLFPTGSTLSEQGNQFFTGVNFTPRAFPYYHSISSGVTSNHVTQWAMAFNPVPFAMTIAAKFIYTGMAECYGAGNGVVCMLTNEAAGPPFFGILQSNAAGALGYQAQHGNGTTVTALQTALPAAGDVVLLRANLRADGSLEFGQTINDNAETVVVSSGTPPAVAPAWAIGVALRTAFATLGGEEYLALGAFAGAPSAAYIAGVMR